VLVAGDLNMSPGRARRSTSLTALATAPTYPRGGPREQLDHLLAHGQVTVTSAAARALAVSDHCALHADLEAWRLA
jgi:endonuclease/exonuclease/phosphatase family metal-dependent hydrolase